MSHNDPAPEATPQSFPFPEGPEDGDTYFHKDLVFYYHGALNTWEVRRINTWEN